MSGFEPHPYCPKEFTYFQIWFDCYFARSCLSAPYVGALAIASIVAVGILACAVFLVLDHVTDRRVGMSCCFRFCGCNVPCLRLRLFLSYLPMFLGLAALLIMLLSILIMSTYTISVLVRKISGGLLTDYGCWLCGRDVICRE